jgi:hypothetical protein
MSRLAIAALCWAACLGASPAISPEKSHSAKEKLEQIAEGKLKPGMALVLSEDEINSYLRYDYASEIPAGISNPHISLEPDRVRGSAVVDFLEWGNETGTAPGPLLSWMLRGKRPVEAVCHYASSDGYGQVDVESVKIGGVSLSAAAITFLIDNLVTPRFPGAVVGRRAPLGFHLRQVRIEQGRAVFLAR